MEASQIYHRNGIALEGYDVVSIWNGHLEKGRETCSYEFSGVKWLFNSKQNRLSFIKSPEDFLPEYGGFCSYGVANGYKAPIKVYTAAIVDNKLYFNFSGFIKKHWQENRERLIPEANARWGQMAGDPTIKVLRPWIYFKYLALGTSFFEE